MINISIDSNSSSFAISISYQLPSPLPSHPYYSYRDLYHSLTYNHHQEYSSYISIPSRNNIMTSSPITFEIGDNRDKLTNYFHWLAVVYPAMEEQLQEYLFTLKSEQIVYGTLLDVPTVLWKEWGVVNGLVIMVQRHTKKWKREQTKGHA